MQLQHTRRKAVAPVLATLMMIAVAVAMSVIIFVWSQGFLSQTSSAAGGQQSQQNIAAQSSISIETAVFDTTNQKVYVLVRDVGSVAVTLGSLTVQGAPTNSGLKDTITCLSTASCTVAGPTTGTAATGSAVSTVAVAKSGSQTITLTLTTITVSSGDIINIKVTTSAGTFATQQFTVP